jgi:hypothetical protein
MLTFRRAPSSDSSALSEPREMVRFRPSAVPVVRRRLSREAGRALEILGHAIEYLGDEYAFDAHTKGPLGNADPRVAAIQILMGLNREVFFSGMQVQPAFRRIRRWFIGMRSVGSQGS